MSDGKEYSIAQLDDFLKVPVDRLDDCLTEFRDYLNCLRISAETFQDFAKSMGAKGEVSLGEFVWIDDGKRDVTVRLQIEATG